MKETVKLKADNDMKEMEQLLKRCGQYIESGYKLEDFKGSDKSIQATFSYEKVQREVGFKA
jgi:hypothetical protein